MNDQPDDINTENPVVTRFAPSPTGPFHVGGVRTALFNWLYTQKHGGRMILRFEDTDTERSKDKFAQAIMDGLNWLGVDYAGPYRQSERTDIYSQYLQQLIDDGSAYRSDETDEDGKRDEVIRFNNPNKEVTFTDTIRGEITMDTTDLGDFVIAKSLSEPLYHFAVVVDDHEMDVTHVIRGNDHTSNTPRQILLVSALGADRPAYAHLPLIHGQDGQKLSKRHGDTALSEFREEGYLPSAVINYLALLGWHPQDDREVLTPEELINEFELDRVQKGPATFSHEKLRWMNREHTKQLDEEAFYDHVREYLPADINTRAQFSKPRLRKALPAIRDRTETFGDVRRAFEAGEFSFFFARPDYSKTDLIWDDDDPGDTKQYLKEVISKLQTVSGDDFAVQNVKDAIWEYASSIGRGSVLWPMRFALSGQDESPGPFEIAAIIGKDETLKRIEFAVNKLSSR